MNNSEQLYDAVRRGNLVRVEEIIHGGLVDINWGSPKGKTALIAAIDEGRPDIALFLIQNGADVNKGSKHNYTPLHHAVMKKSVPMVEMLLSHGANPNIPNSNGDTPLNLAAWQGNQLMVDALRIGRAKLNHSAVETSRIYHPEIDIHRANKINTLNTMYFMQEGLPEANAFNRMDPQSWTDLNEYYGGKKRTNRRRPNKKRTNRKRTNKRR